MKSLLQNQRGIIPLSLPIFLTGILLLVPVFGEISAKRPSHPYLHPPKKPEGVTLPPEEWFTQKLDHFDQAETRTWSQRYYKNLDFYQPGGPVFLMIGGEGPADAIWMVEGAWITYAQQLNAALLQLEHRFYGKSHPTEDSSVENLVYLSSEQALADLAEFTVKMKEELGFTDNKWIAFGGSYPGSLAAWYRLKYPDLVHASIATSAPLIAQLDFREYLEVVRNSLASESDERCNEAIQQATDEIGMLLGRPTGWHLISDEFRLCTVLDGTIKEDVSNMHELLAENIEGVVQYNKDNRAFEGVKDTNITINFVCDIMSSVELGTPVARYAAINSLLLDIHGRECFEHQYSVMIEEYKKTNWDQGAVGGRSWFYQTCSEFGWYQGSDSTEQPFGDKFPLEFFTQMCQDIYGPSFTVEFIQEAIDKTNAKYGGLTPEVTRVAFVNGNIDPWHALGITSDLSSEAPAIFIQGTAHCANMYPPTPDDLPQLTEAREKIFALIQQWLSEE
ncbi:putative serine protease K12H4.7 [Palaemon carinicauda]|uniref:putative serine protease K12H4.7 n=1 Tax=Palaemon carinicauda TaxID=392227 RepID=UPI0035B60161